MVASNPYICTLQFTIRWFCPITTRYKQRNLTRIPAIRVSCSNRTRESKNMICYAIPGCDIVSALIGKGKTRNVSDEVLIAK